MGRAAGHKPGGGGAPRPMGERVRRGKRHLAGLAQIPHKPAMHDTIRKILTARVYDVAIETPLDPMPRLSARLGAPLLLKREDLQPVFSFKIRGAYNKIAALSEDELARGVICASAGNHAQGVALAAA